MLSQAVARVGTALFVLLLIGLVVGQLLGQPVGLAYVESGSMEPTINEGDGFVAIPAALSPPPQEGDIITFEAEQIEGGGLTTHRVVEETSEGYITRGDANPFTDQDGPEPPVTDDQIVATTPQVGDTVLRLPHLGTGIEAVQSGMTAATTVVVDGLGLDVDVTPGTVGTWVFGLGLVLFALSARPGSTTRTREVTRSREQDGLDGRKVAVVVIAAVLIPANAAMIGPAGPTELTVDGDEVAEAGLAPGEEVEAEVEVRNGGLITLLFVFEPAATDVTVTPETTGVPPGEAATTTATIPAPEPGTDRTVTVTEYRYLVVGPERLFEWLHGVHPLAALGALNLIIAGGFLGFVGGLIGFRTVRARDTTRELPLWLRLKRWLR